MEPTQAITPKPKPKLQGVSRMDRKGAKRFIRQFKQPLVITSVEVAKAVRHRENVMGKTSLAIYYAE